MPKRTPKERQRTLADEMAEIAKSGEAIRAKLPRGPGGDALLSVEAGEALATLVREGMPIEGACRVAGIARKTLGLWIQQGVEDVSAGLESVASRFAWTLEAALGDQERALVGLVMRGAAKDATVALGILAVRRPDHWSPAQPAPGDAKQLYAGLSEAELRAEVERIVASKARALPPKEADAPQPIIVEGVIEPEEPKT